MKPADTMAAALVALLAPLAGCMDTAPASPVAADDCGGDLGGPAVLVEALADPFAVAGLLLEFFGGARSSEYDLHEGGSIVVEAGSGRVIHEDRIAEWTTDECIERG